MAPDPRMPARTRAVDAIDPRFRGHFGYTQWTLCIGAGVSNAIVPSWLELTRRIINFAFNASFTYDEFAEHVFREGWGLDAWLQSAANRYQLDGHTYQEFQDLLQTSLYSDLLTHAETAGVKDALIDALNWPRKIGKKNVHRLCAFFQTTYGHTSLLGLVRWALDAQKKGKLPNAVITFNAETLFHTVFELFQREEHYKQPSPHSHPNYCFTRVFEPTIVRRHNTGGEAKISIYHCHGVLLPRKGKKANSKEEPIVFLEQDYLKVSSRAATWPETLFMFHAQLGRMLFVGTSMADPNMRRWLGLSEELKKSVQPKPHTASGPPHVWVTLQPKLRSIAELKQEGLWHMGTRPAWLSSWDRLEFALRNLTAT